MSLTVSASSGGGNFVQVPPGMHLARCYRIIDLGTQKTTYKGTEKMSPKVLFQFEVHSENDEGEPLLTPEGKPLSISKQYTLSLNENAILRHDLQSWRGRAFTEEELKSFDLQNVLGQWCMLSVVHSQVQDKTYANVENVNPVPAAIKKNGLPEGANSTVLFSIRSADMEVFETLSENIQNKIKAAPEWEAWKDAPAPTPKQESAKSNDPADFEDDIPF